MGLTTMSQKNETPALILALLITLGLIGGGLWWFLHRPGAGVQSIISSLGQSGSSQSSSNRISLGDKLLITKDSNADKQAGTEAIARQDYATAINRLESALTANRNDPETLIYLNNAKAASGPTVKIAVAVPIGSNLNVAQEILRGVAQAQDEVNQQGGIGGAKLQVAIANDDNNPQTAEQIAQALVQDSSILAVVGHNSSDASLAAAPVYQAGQLVMISPTSDAKALSGFGSYIFRTVPDLRLVAQTLSRYVVETARKRTLLACIDSQAQYSQTLKDEFSQALSVLGGQVAQTPCDVSANFNPTDILSQAISEGAEAILLIPSVDRLNQAIEIAQANQGRLSLLGSSTLYTFATLQQGQAATNGMVLAVAWHPTAFPGNPFPKRAVQLWGGAVNWRSAIAYDATQAIIEGLQQDKSRAGLQRALSAPGFRAEGATGPIQFMKTGDRQAAVILVKIQPGQSSGTGYDFAPLP